MRLLVSVANATDASAALRGGADIIDAKDPLTGAIGAVHVDVLRAIHAAVGGARPISAALGDAGDESVLERAARLFTAAGAVLVKVGFAGTPGERIGSLVSAAVQGATTGGQGNAGVIAVTYADADPAASPLSRVGSVAAAGALAELSDQGANGVLLDTADKSGPGLCQLVGADALAAWIGKAHEAGLLVAVAGKLTADDLAFVREAGADIAGVRGAACEGGRAGHVRADRVRILRALCQPGLATATQARHHHQLTPGAAHRGGPRR